MKISLKGKIMIKVLVAMEIVLKQAKIPKRDQNLIEACRVYHKKAGVKAESLRVICSNIRSLMGINKLTKVNQSYHDVYDCYKNYTVEELENITDFYGTTK